MDIDSTATGSIFRNNILTYVAIVRPLNAKDLTVSDSAKALMANSGMTASKTAMERGQSVAPGETITYTISIDNEPSYGGTALARTVTVTDPLDDKVSFVSATNGGSVKDGAVVFENVAVGADDVVTLSYTVKVKDDGPDGYKNVRCCKEGPVFDSKEVVW